MADDDERAMAAGASAWARHGREDIQGSHSLSAPLARWAPELVEPEAQAPIAGLVIAVLATTGERVTRRQPVMVIEAMKMQNNVSPEVDGVLVAVHVSPGDAVKAGQVLFELL